jgi:hypothetical protein
MLSCRLTFVILTDVETQDVVAIAKWSFSKRMVVIEVVIQCLSQKVLFVKFRLALTSDRGATYQTV